MPSVTVPVFSYVDDEELHFSAGIGMQEFGITQIFLGSNFSLNFSKGK